MAASFPFLTHFDPVGNSEGTLDPLGVYQVAELLATELVPAVRERMQRIRFLTAMAVGALVTEGLQEDPSRRESAPFLVWEWLVIESFVRSLERDESFWGVHGSDVTIRAVRQHGYLDARSYLKTARIFGFHGVYKRLAAHLGIVDVHLRRGPLTEQLVDAWSRDRGHASLHAAQPVLNRWREAVEASLREQPPRTRPRWGNVEWATLADSFELNRMGQREKRFLRDQLTVVQGPRLGALPAIWALQSDFRDDLDEERLHKILARKEPRFGNLLTAIQAYEAFIRGIQDAFDLLLAEAAVADSRGFDVGRIASDKDFAASVKNLDTRFRVASDALGALAGKVASARSLFDERFHAFGAKMAPTDVATMLCEHHVKIQGGKSVEGKRPWFDRLGPNRIYVRHSYRRPRPVIAPERYVTTYRGRPIRRFYLDLQ